MATAVGQPAGKPREHKATGPTVDPCPRASSRPYCVAVDLAGDVSLGTADGFATGVAFGDAAGEVVAGAGVPAQAGQGDAAARWRAPAGSPGPG
ncbi:MAG: hypothetical protein QOH50_5539 [Kribbellaceae bacterium]|nr:hypothetical protein [Kribbellaceae bacterium]